MLGDLGLAGGDHQGVVSHSGDLAGEQSVNILKCVYVYSCYSRSTIKH